MTQFVAISFIGLLLIQSVITPPGAHLASRRRLAARGRCSAAW